MRGPSTARRTMVLSVASVEMTFSSFYAIFMRLWSNSLEANMTRGFQELSVS